MQQYDIYLVNLDPRKWHVQSGNRPCVIVSANIFNKYAPTVVVVPLTTTLRDVFPSEFIIEPTKTNGLSEKSRFLWSQIITIDKDFFGKKLGTLDRMHHAEVERAVKLVLGM